MSRRPKLSDVTIDRARKMLAENVPVANIARALRIGETTVSGIKHGKRGVATKPPKSKAEPAKPPKPDRHGLVYFRVNARVVWCTVCCCHVRSPCFACQIRALPKSS